MENNQVSGSVRISGSFSSVGRQTAEMSRQINCLPVEQFHRPPLIKKRAEENKKALNSIRENNRNALVVVERNNGNVVVVVEGKQKKCSGGGGGGGITIKICRWW